MPSNEWSSEAQLPSQSGTPWWLKILLGTLGSGLVLGLVILANVQSMRGRAWPIIRKITQRIQTDAGALDLYRANPELGAKYGSEDAFLETVRNYRSQFSALPERPPKEAEDYRCFPTPSSFRAGLKGKDGGWLRIFVQGHSYFNQVRGEGLHRLDFAPTREAIEEEDRSRRRARAQADWKRFREMAAQLATEEGSRRLWRSEPSLAKGFENEDAFLQEVRNLRPFLETPPESITLAGPRLRRRVHRTPLGEDRRLTYAFAGGTLTLVWREDRLTEVQFKKGGGL